jgi:probable phosphoglycerate mutase
VRRDKVIRCGSGGKDKKLRNVYVVVHPEATHHVERVVGGWHDSSLTPGGRRAAAEIAAALRSRIPADAPVQLFSSDLLRTRQTADVIGAVLGAEPAPDPRLREKSYGAAGGKPQAWLDERFIPPPATGDRMHHQEGIEGAETRGELAERVYAATEAILASGGEHQVIVTHGFAQVFVLACWIGMPLEAAGYVGFAAPSGSITVLREDERFGNRQIVSLGDTGHLG